ncbi:MAG TPA: acyl-CoA dehydrogenase family protein [Acidimicrobiales bacterium]|nr:acyl-CoA dehydrogenase family protein [Acidimicrobiales bacterium]
MLEELAALEPFRQEVRAWCRTHVPPDWRETQRGAGHDEFVAFGRWWAGQLRDAGWLAPHWPKEWGGGFTVAEQVVLAEELARGDAPRNGLYQVALYNAAPAIIHAGTDEQCRHWLPGILDGEVWCQGFSEPNAGSDLASLQTRAVRDGDHYVVTGQKVWTSVAMEADWCILLARSDPDAPKHKGITYLVVDMHAPGVEVRPLRQATGAAEFCETFLDGVVVSVEHRIGAENEGWTVAQTSLASERAVVILGLAELLRRNGVERVIADAGTWPLEDGQAAGDDPAVRETLAARYAEALVLRYLINDMIDGVIRGVDVGATSSVIKLMYSELLQGLMRDATDIQGLPAQLDRPLLPPAGWESGNWMLDYINSWSWTIAGGSNEIMRNIIGERMLGLPR